MNKEWVGSRIFWHRPRHHFFIYILVNNMYKQESVFFFILLLLIYFFNFLLLLNLTSWKQEIQFHTEGYFSLTRKISILIDINVPIRDYCYL